MNIAIDGPAGAGKSTIAKLLATRLNFVYLDTGAMYRAVALAAVRAGVSLSDERAAEKLLDGIRLDIRYENGTQRVFLDGEDVGEKIRENAVSRLASEVSALKAVRLKMVEMQRALACGRDVILDGRDIGTFVLPGAEVKFFLTASVVERAKRRFAELTDRGQTCRLEEVEREISERDYMDSHREFAPLKKAADAIEVDTTALSIEEVTEKLARIIREKAFGDGK